MRSHPSTPALPSPPLPHPIVYHRGPLPLPRTLIAIPVFNEARHVEHVLRRVLSFHPEVLLVDDGSTDGTADLLARRSDVHLIRHRANAGYGQSLIDAFAYARSARFDWVLTMDCDEQHEPEMIPAFLDLIREDRWDLISGTRYKVLREDDDQAPQDRAAINACLTRLLNSLYSIVPGGLTDSFCGFKAHRVSTLAGFALTEPGYAFPMQLWPQVVHTGTRVTEMSVRRIYNDPKRSFGATLDQPLVRLRHYLDVLAIEHQRLFNEVLDLPDARDLLNGVADMPGLSPAAAQLHLPTPHPTLAQPSPSTEEAPCRGCCCA